MRRLPLDKVAVREALLTTDESTTKIAERFGVTQSWIAQLAKSWGLDSKARFARRVARRRAEAKARRGYGLTHFVRVIRKHLALIGHGYCYRCHGSPALSEMAAGGRICRPCAAQLSEDNRTRFKEKIKARREANRGKYYQYHATWRQRNPDKVSGYNRAYYRKTHPRAENKETS